MPVEPERWLRHSDAVLRASGLRASASRRAVAETLARGGCLLSAHDILTRLRDGAAVSASPATIYRTLDLLHAHGLVRRIDAGEGIARYEPADPSGHDDHQHVVFEDGTVQAFSDDELSRAVAGLGRRLGVEVTSYELVVHARVTPPR